MRWPTQTSWNLGLYKSEGSELLTVIIAQLIDEFVLSSPWIILSSPNFLYTKIASLSSDTMDFSSCGAVLAASLTPAH